jgi:hypothetical protein
VLNFSFSDYVNKLQCYYLLSVSFRCLHSSVLLSSVFTIHWSRCIYKLNILVDITNMRVS